MFADGKVQQREAGRMSKWKVYALYFADWDDPFDRCYCGEWRFQGVGYGKTEDDAIRCVQKKKLHFTDCESSVSYGIDSNLKRRDWAGVLWKAERRE